MSQGSGRFLKIHISETNIDIDLRFFSFYSWDFTIFFDTLLVAEKIPLFRPWCFKKKVHFLFTAGWKKNPKMVHKTYNVLDNLNKMVSQESWECSLYYKKETVAYLEGKVHNRPSNLPCNNPIFPFLICAKQNKNAMTTITRKLERQNNENGINKKHCSLATSA